MMICTIPKRLLSGTAVLVLLLPITGCKFMSMFRHTDSGTRTDITEMPRLTTSDLDAVGRRLASAGLKVAVKHQEIVVRKKTGEIAVTLPEMVRPFEPSQWNHLVAAQDPPAGTPVKPGSVITLTAGIHHGAGPFRPWLDAHGGSVKIRGEQRCRDCHTEKYCSSCHDQVRR